MFQQARANAISNRVKSLLGKAGVLGENNHSASSSKSYTLGTDLHVIISHGTLSHTSTFAKHYNKPILSKNPNNFACRACDVLYSTLSNINRTNGNNYSTNQFILRNWNMLVLVLVRRKHHLPHPPWKIQTKGSDKFAVSGASVKIVNDHRSLVM